MIHLRMTDLLLTAPVTHTSTDWQVASDMQFTTIIAESLGDVNNLSAILFNQQLDPAVQYYARARSLLSTGYTAWSNIDIFTPTDIMDGVSQTALPATVSVPQVSITNNGIDVPVFNTTITLANVVSTGNTTHESTSYILEDIYGKPIWSSLNNVDDKLTKIIPPDVLTINRVYRLRVLVHTDSNDTSQLVTTTIKTESRTRGLIITATDHVDATVDMFIDVAPTTGVTSITGNLWGVVNKELVSIGTYVGSGVSGNIIQVPALDLKPANKYILVVNTNDIAIWDQRTFHTIP